MHSTYPEYDLELTPTYEMVVLIELVHPHPAAYSDFKDDVSGILMVIPGLFWMVSGIELTTEFSVFALLLV